MIQWYVMRATGVVTLALFTVTVVLGLLNRSRVRSDRWPRFVIDRLHRNASLLAVAFLFVHILTAVTDSFVSVHIVDAVVPFYGSYRPLWIGLGAVALDLLVALILTSLVRVRLGVRTWRGIHWLAYLAWPVAVAHGLGIGTDSGRVWMLAIEAVCIGSVLAALTIRLRSPMPLAGQAW
jgi:DMSO/TMAO reductase YedYZ heme-binding membrane subunit